MLQTVGHTLGNEKYIYEVYEMRYVCDNWKEMKET